jgi:glycosyltransferase involved in cell wall biosynthesis
MSRDRGSLNIAMIGTRGVPAAYGGFETAVEEIGKRLVVRGHRVVVYCRTGESRQRTHLGMRLVHLPALKLKAAETLSHTALSVCHLAVNSKPDVALVFNAANAPFLPVLRGCRVPTAVHVDGLEWKRGKWGRMGRRYYRSAEKAAVRWSDALIADAQGIADYYDERFGVPTELLTYGAPILESPGHDRITGLGLEPRRYHLVVARFEPENHVDMIVEGYHRSSGELPLIVVGSAPYSAEYTRTVENLAAQDSRIRMLGSIWDQELLDQLYSNALTYVHGHSVGGTNPSLLRAMGGATSVLAFDVGFNREVVGAEGSFFGSSGTLRQYFDSAESNPQSHVLLGQRLQRRAQQLYDWDDVTLGYEELSTRLASGYSIHKNITRSTPNNSRDVVRLP